MRKQSQGMLLQDTYEAIRTMSRLGFVAVTFGYMFTLTASLLGYIPDLVRNTALHTILFILHYMAFLTLKKRVGLFASPGFFLLTCICTSYAFWMITLYGYAVPDMYTMYYVLPVVSVLLLDIRFYLAKYLVDAGSFVFLHLAVLGYSPAQDAFALIIRTIHLTASYLIIYAVFCFKDSAERKLSKTYQEKLEADRRALTDELTGCYNYRFLRQELSRLQQEGRAPRLIFIDLDDFKLINDRYGHLTGDRVLKQVSGTIRDNLRESDFLVRYGGDEFCVILGGETRKDPHIARRLQDTISALRFVEDGEEFGITFSVGEAEVDGACSAEEILSQADKKLYEEKIARKVT